MDHQQRLGKPAPNVAQSKLQQEKQMEGEPLNCTHSELCTYLQGLAEGYLATSCLDIIPYARSKSTPIASKSYQHGKKTVVFHGFQSLEMLRPLTASRGEDLLTWFQEDFRARTSVAPEREQASTEREVPCGSTWRESSARYCRNSSSWKTHLCLWDEALESSSLTLPRWGMMRDGVLWERMTQALPTSENESGLWRTPMACDWKNMSCSSQIYLQDQVKMWPTPQAHKTTRSGEIVNADGTPWDGIRKPHSKTSGRPITTALADAVKMWPTPTRNDAVGAGYQRANGNHYFTLPGAVGATKHLPPEMEEKRMRTWPTPVASMAKENQKPRTPGTKGTQTTLAIEAGGSLNPTWVEWLMNWPKGWTDIETNCKHEYKYWKTASAANGDGNLLREMWFNREAGAPPQGQEPNEQPTGEHPSSVFDLPRRRASDASASVMRGLRENLSAEAVETSEIVREFRLQQDSRKELSRVAVGVKCRVDRLKAIGNGQVPSVAALAWRVLGGG